jgi:hypothetical protein
VTRRVLYGGLAALGLALFLWPALAAPVVRWSDSELDLDWARSGVGILSPVVSPHHPPKPGYILFLRAALALGPAQTGARRVIVIQSLLLWLSMGITALLVGRRVGARYGVALYVALILFMRLRDSSSAVMSEALTAALLLPIAAVLLDPPRRAATAALLGLAIAALFLVRPNAGALALVLGTVSFAIDARPRQIALLLLGFVLLWAPFWRATAVRDDPFRGMAPAFVTGSLDYGWTPEREHHEPEPPPFVQVRSALESWKATFAEERGDRGRQLAWRALHGLLGTDFYDARWSPWYARATRSSRVVTPLLVLACAAVLMAAPFRGATRAAKALGLLIGAMLVAQSLVLGALPRLALPFLPLLLLYGIAALPGLEGSGRRLAAAGLFALFVGFVAWQRQVLDWEWGRIESSGLRVVQTIPRGALPEKAPATLHVRIAPLLVPTNAGLEVLGPGGEKLWSGPTDGSGGQPFLTMSMPASLLEANRRGPVEIVLASRGDYDGAHFLVFPVIPRPWGQQARREGSEELSPASGITSGSLDWWAHRGTR